MNQINDQDIHCRQTRTYLHYLNGQQGGLTDNIETLIKEIYHHQVMHLKSICLFLSS